MVCVFVRCSVLTNDGTFQKDQNKQMSSNEVIPQFPSPPAHYKRFKHGLAAEQEDDMVGDDQLAPPAPPSSGEYLLFGETRKLEEKTQTLESEGLRTLFDVTAPPQQELGLLVSGSKQKFKTILALLADNAAQDLVDDALKEFHLQLVNMMYLVNEMRNAEAKDEVLKLLENQISLKQHMVDILKETVEKSQQNIDAAFAELAFSTTQDVIAIAENNDKSTTKDDENRIDMEVQKFQT